jgi:uncharacterized protein (DUF2252 family)
MPNRASSKNPSPARRADVLKDMRHRKMAKSLSSFIRGNTEHYYAWLQGEVAQALPDGPSIWIGGDCHFGNLGPTGEIDDEVELAMRDFDQTVIGNPVHDLIRLNLSLLGLALSAGRSGQSVIELTESLVDGYADAFRPEVEEAAQRPEAPRTIRYLMKKAAKRTWKSLARDRTDGTSPTLPLGKDFWQLTGEETKDLHRLLLQKDVARLAARAVDGDAETFEIRDVAFWRKGCSSLGELRYAAIASLGTRDDREFVLIDIKEAATSLAPRKPDVSMPRSNAERVVEGARHLAPGLGDRMTTGNIVGRGVFVRQLMPQDMKVEIRDAETTELRETAFALGGVVGSSHARQMSMDDADRWRKEVLKGKTRLLDAPSWLWQSVAELLALHQAAYLEHCRRYYADLRA